MNDPTRVIADAVREIMARIARVLNKISDGAIKPVHITILSFIGHLPAAWALWGGRPVLASALITIFGLLDSLDGALAREQKVASRLGMYFDAVTDRLKEILLYTAIAAYGSRFAPDIQPWLVAGVAGTSMLVSYVKAKGEMALSETQSDVQQLNRTFDVGLARYEVRMTLLVVGLLTGTLDTVLRFVIAINLFTASLRFNEVSRLISEFEIHQRLEEQAAQKAKKSQGKTKPSRTSTAARPEKK